MAKKLTNNIGLKILAVLAAAVLWLVATNINDPVIRKTFSGVSVSVENLSTLTNNDKYVEVLDDSDTIKVTVRAARSVLAEISEKDIVAVADAEKMTEGNYIPIELNCNKGYIDKEDIKPDKDYVHVSVENIKRRQLPIYVAVDGEVGEGYLLGLTSPSQNAVMLSGPESLVNKVSSVSVDVDVEGATSDVNISLPIHLYDSAGEEITDKRINKSISTVSVVASVLLRKEISIEFGYTGAPAEGYYVDGKLSSSVNSITVAGKESVLKNLQKLELKDIINITDATHNVEEIIDLRKYLPDGVTFAESDANTKTTLSLKIEQKIEEPEEELEEEE